MRRRLLLFFTLIDFVLVCCFLYQWGGGLVHSLGQNMSVKFYNGILNIYVPGILYVQGDGISDPYQDMTHSVYPAIAYNEERLWYQAKEDSLSDYENLAAMENEQAKQMIEENRKAAQVKKVDETADEEVKVATGKDKAGEKKVTINRKKLEDFDYLRQTFYQVDSTTTIGKKQLNVKKLLTPDMTVDMETEGPQILIYHTHSQEGYKDSKPGDAATSVVGVGDYLTELLEKEGFEVLHHKGEYDVNDRDHAYSNAAPHIQKILEENPTIQVVIDLHRDGVGENTRLVTKQNGKKMAKIMFFNGLSRTTAAGDIAYLKNPYIDENLAFSFQMQLKAAEYYPDLTRRIYLKGYRFNMHFCPKSMLVEVGAQTNTFEEAKNSMEPLADLLAKVLKSED
ncbi:MAG: stage II sporulation protein P [Lachnospiraceae bacterium]|nr:stage II sporulation protein P [Lachnospiraceae bacterium]